jgi:hypothetical protein
MYHDSAAQTCATQHPNMCTNPITALLASNLVEFNFPIGESAVNSMHWSNPSVKYSLYVYFDISVVDSSGRVTTTKLFAQSAISELSISRNCESLQVKS